MGANDGTAMVTTTTTTTTTTRWPRFHLPVADDNVNHEKYVERHRRDICSVK